MLWALSIPVTFVAVVVLLRVFGQKSMFESPPETALAEETRAAATRKCIFCGDAATQPVPQFSRDEFWVDLLRRKFGGASRFRVAPGEIGVCAAHHPLALEDAHAFLAEIEKERRDVLSRTEARIIHYEREGRRTRVRALIDGEKKGGDS